MSFNFFSLASIWARISWNFHKGRRDLICYGYLRHFGKMFWGRRVRTRELTDV